ncbi:hypothetical protein [Paraburkholderia heleia]|uniref:hypothetical protein n=1 Tax=Paraburkholderia heleia TaxID=634127 RepID=UPI002AB7E5BB|nr:hypothetical protein [Paraburkholderia heleia]
MKRSDIGVGFGLAQRRELDFMERPGGVKVKPISASIAPKSESWMTLSRRQSSGMKSASCCTPTYA